MTNDDRAIQGGLTEREKRDNVVRLAFGGQSARFDDFCRAIEKAIPGGTTVVLRGSAVTGYRWSDHVPFGPGHRAPADSAPRRARCCT